jgi:hypothetical protein
VDEDVGAALPHGRSRGPHQGGGEQPAEHAAPGQMAEVDPSPSPGGHAYTTRPKRLDTSKTAQDSAVSTATRTSAAPLSPVWTAV